MILNYDKLCKFQIGGSLILGPKKGAPASQAASSEWPACAHDPLPRVGRRLAAMLHGGGRLESWRWVVVRLYPLVNIQKTMEHGHL